MKLSAKQAAKKVGKSVTTITRAIKSGKISASKKAGGGYQIDASELFRVFPAVERDETLLDPVAKGLSGPFGTPQKIGVSQNALNENTVGLRDQLRHLEKMTQRERELLERQIEDLRAERDEWRGMAQTQQSLVERMTEDQALLTSRLNEKEKRGFFKRLFG